MKKSITLLLIMAFQLNCLITDYALPPADAIRGDSLVEELQASASSGFLAGITQNPNASAMLESLPAASTNILLASILAGKTATRVMDIDENKYYTNTSAEECKTAVFNAYFSVMILQIEPPPVSGSIVSNSICDLKTTGKIIHFSDELDL